MCRSLIVLAILATSSHLALAADVLGEWARDDGKTYTGKMMGAHLVTSGCIFGGPLRESAAWARAQ